MKGAFIHLRWTEAPHRVSPGFCRWAAAADRGLHGQPDGVVVVVVVFAGGVGGAGLVAAGGGVVFFGVCCVLGVRSLGGARRGAARRRGAVGGAGGCSRRGRNPAGAGCSVLRGVVCDAVNRQAYQDTEQRRPEHSGTTCGPQCAHSSPPRLLTVGSQMVTLPASTRYSGRRETLI